MLNRSVRRTSHSNHTLELTSEPARHGPVHAEIQTVLANTKKLAVTFARVVLCVASSNATLRASTLHLLNQSGSSSNGPDNFSDMARGPGSKSYFVETE